jgi:hypothetical protein
MVVTATLAPGEGVLLILYPQSQTAVQMQNVATAMRTWFGGTDQYHPLLVMGFVRTWNWNYVQFGIQMTTVSSYFSANADALVPAAGTAAEQIEALVAGGFNLAVVDSRASAVWVAAVLNSALRAGVFVFVQTGNDDGPWPQAALARTIRSIGCHPNLARFLLLRRPTSATQKEHVDALTALRKIAQHDASILFSLAAAPTAADAVALAARTGLPVVTLTLPPPVASGSSSKQRMSSTAAELSAFWLSRLPTVQGYVVESEACGDGATAATVRFQAYTAFAFGSTGILQRGLGQGCSSGLGPSRAELGPTLKEINVRFAAWAGSIANVGCRVVGVLSTGWKIPGTISPSQPTAFNRLVKNMDDDLLVAFIKRPASINKLSPLLLVVDKRSEGARRAATVIFKPATVWSWAPVSTMSGIHGETHTCSLSFLGPSLSLQLLPGEGMLVTVVTSATNSTVNSTDDGKPTPKRLSVDALRQLFAPKKGGHMH